MYYVPCKELELISAQLLYERNLIEISFTFIIIEQFIYLLNNIANMRAHIKQP